MGDAPVPRTALTLDCICPGAVTGTLCTVIHMTLDLSVTYAKDTDTSNTTTGPYGANGVVHVDCAPVSLTWSSPNPTPVGTWAYTFDLTPNLTDVIANWHSMTTTMTFGHSLLQTPAHVPGCILTSHWLIHFTYRCVDLVTGATISTQIVQATSTDSATATCEPVTGDLRATASIGVGGGVCNVFETTPLGLCSGVSASVNNFQPTPKNQTLDLGSSGGCLCATGGTPPYKFSVTAGRLPSGINLDPDSGCTSGTADGNYGPTASVTFTVMDSTGATASTECAFNPCADVVPISTGNYGYTALVIATDTMPPASTGVYDEVPSGTINGANVTFTLANAPNPPESLMLYLNGVDQKPGTDFTLSGNVITFVKPPIIGDWILADYWY